MKIAILFASLISCSLGVAIDLSGYVPVFSDDFSSLCLSLTNLTDPTYPNSKWVAQVHRVGDTNVPLNSNIDYYPFHIGASGLTIRANQSQYGALSSMDRSMNGFSIQHGYIEVSMKMPKCGNETKYSYTRMYLCDVDSIPLFPLATNQICYKFMEHDLYTAYRSHYYIGNRLFQAIDCSMAEQFHTFGLDFSSDYIAMYFDGQVQHVIGSSEASIPFNKTMFIGIDHYFNSITPCDCEIEYIKVWNGSGGTNLTEYFSTPSTPNYYYPGIFFTPQFGEYYNGVYWNLTQDGKLLLVNYTSQEIIMSSNTTCNASCYINFDPLTGICLNSGGGEVLYSSGGHPNATVIKFLSAPPYFSLLGPNCSTLPPMDPNLGEFHLQRGIGYPATPPPITSSQPITSGEITSASMTTGDITTGGTSSSEQTTGLGTTGISTEAPLEEVTTKAITTFDQTSNQISSTSEVITSGRGYRVVNVSATIAFNDTRNPSCKVCDSQDYGCSKQGWLNASLGLIERQVIKAYAELVNADICSNNALNESADLELFISEKNHKYVPLYSVTNTPSSCCSNKCVVFRPSQTMTSWPYADVPLKMSLRTTSASTLCATNVTITFSVLEPIIDEISEAKVDEPRSKKSNTGLIVGLVVGLAGGLLLIAVIIAVVILLRRSKKSKNEDVDMSAINENDNEDGEN